MLERPRDFGVPRCGVSRLLLTNVTGLTKDRPRVLLALYRSE